jgi:hypothetical protein
MTSTACIVNCNYNNGLDDRVRIYWAPEMRISGIVVAFRTPDAGSEAGRRCDGPARQRGSGSFVAHGRLVMMGVLQVKMVTLTVVRKYVVPPVRPESLRRHPV